MSLLSRIIWCKKLLSNPRLSLSKGNTHDECLYLQFILISARFPEVASIMASHLRRFVTSPLLLCEFEFAEDRAPPLAAAAKCLALCIKVCLMGNILVKNNL